MELRNSRKKDSYFLHHHGAHRLFRQFATPSVPSSFLKIRGIIATIKKNATNNHQFTEFLDQCILSRNPATNNAEARKESKSPDEIQLKITPAPLVVRLFAEMQIHGMARCTPLAKLREDLAYKYNALMEQAQITITISFFKWSYYANT